MRALLFCALLAACETPMPIEDYPCPPGGTPLTYQSFGRAFLDTNCNSCHSAESGYRNGAPSSYRFDTLDDVHAHEARIFIRAAASNTTMPPGPDDPSPESRDQLAEWLACGAP